MRRAELKRSQIKARKTKKLSDYDAEFAAIRNTVMREANHLCGSSDFMPDDEMEAFDEMFATCLVRANHVHHRKLRANGGTNNRANLTPLCGNCHRYVHDHPAFSYRYGLMLHAGDPEE